MHWIAILVLGLASSLDNLSIGITYGTRGKQLSYLSNILITFLSMIASYLSLFIGKWMSHFIPLNMANFGGGMLIVLIGLWTLWIISPFNRQSHSKKAMTDPENVDKDKNNIISLTEALVLGMALSFNSIGTTFSAGVTGLNPLLTTLSVGIFSFLCMEAGLRCGKSFKQRRVGKFASLAAGVSLLLIGLHEILI